ncbi:helix-turn-helix domain-containing protein [Nostoc sp.]|uniref:helix-turn-helix domain-containing protein n=1 Tax=Nostoc sp. TaxID=1180 RepID=UPI002FF55B83
MSPKEGVYLCLVYLRQKPTFDILGLLFDISKTKANDAFNYWVKILREILPASQMEEVEKDSQKYQELRKILCEHELIVDSAEQAILMTCRLLRAKAALLWQEKDVYPEKPVYCVA